MTAHRSFRDRFAGGVLMLSLFFGIDLLLLERLPEPDQPLARLVLAAAVGGTLLVVALRRTRRRLRLRVGRTEALRALRESEARLAEAQHIAHLGSWELDLEKQTLRWSPEHFRIFGLEPHEGDVDLLQGLRSVHPEDAAQLAAMVGAAIEARGSYVAEIRVVRPQGAVRWIQSRGTFVADAYGGAGRMAGTAQDITERVEAERERLRLASHVTSLLAATSEGLYGADRDGRCTFINDAGAAMLGYAPAEVLGQPVHALVHDLGADGTPSSRGDCPIRRVMETATACHVASDVMRRRDGTRLQAEFTANPVLREGQVVGAVVAFRNVTERLLVQASLLESEERLRLALEIGGQGTWDLDVSTGKVVWSAVKERMVGLAPGSFAGTRAAFEAMLHPDDRERVLAAIGATLAGDSELRIEYRMVRPDGTPLWLSSSGRVFRDSDGGPVRMVGVSQDITDHKALEQHRDVLARAEKLRALGQMASGVAHDLNQQFGLVSGYGELAARALNRTGVEAPEVAEMLGIITQAAIDGGETVKRLLTFARGHVDGAPEVVNVGALLLDVAQLTAPHWRDGTQAQGHPVSLRIEATPHLLVEGWPHALREALTNLIFNAVEAMPDGGTLSLSAVVAHGRVAVEVTDEGSGMTPEVQARLFEPFFTTKGEKGTGLGLASVYGIVERHGGQIEVRSTVGRGTTFRIVLPLAPERVSVPAGPAVAAAAPSPLRVLAVEDEPQLRTMVARMVEGLGHQVVTTASGEDALQALGGSERFDVVLSDLGLGDGMNGWELVSRVARGWPSLRVVLVTGWGAEIDPKQAATRGVSDVLCKPYGVEDLRRVLAA